MNETKRFLLMPSGGIFVVLFVFLISEMSCYNISPTPNVIVRDPQLPTDMPKGQTSYFGFALSLRPKGVIVGAPRAQSTLESQRKINETGAVYRCSLINSTCTPYVFETAGNVDANWNAYTYESEKRDFQWLGASMDGGPNDEDRFVVCAPRYVVPINEDYLMHGICYWVNNTVDTEPVVQNVQIIEPLRLKDMQMKKDDGKLYYYYIFGELGISAHITDNDEILLGAPGIHTWKGSVILHRAENKTKEPSLSRRDLSSHVRVARDAVRVEMETIIPNPNDWYQPNDSYFGYSVGSGHFDSTNLQKLMYVATAPQANEQQGEAYLFDIVSGSIVKAYTFQGTQFGEYFGYAVLTEDLNGDGLTDVVVSAPQHSVTGSFDNGAIYVFTNLGNYNFHRTILTAPLQGDARFGTTLAKLGDINHDGFNDIAVGAPFAGNGVVFVYLGTEKGLRSQHSQRFDAPQSNGANKNDQQMFGHGLSKGSDIDGNGFNDFAIGAPNAEAVYVYRSYPVVQIHATISSKTREIKPDQKSFQTTVCYAITTTSTKVKSQDLALRMVLDGRVNRVKLRQTQTNELSFNVSAGLTQQCRVFDCDIQYNVADIFKPIELELHYDLITNGPKHKEFCDSCAAVDPMEPTVYNEKLIFSTGCASDVCVADLKVQSKNLPDSFILGSSRTWTITYEISNSGETAYLPQINLTSSNRMAFSKTPSNCKVSVNNIVMICDLNSRQPMAKGSRLTIDVSYDVSSITGSSMILTAEVFSTGNERTPSDNIVKDVITLKEYTEFEVVGWAKTPHINLEKTSGISEINNIYEIKSNGPSTVKSMEIVFNIPVAYRGVRSGVDINIVDVNSINMQAVYDTRVLTFDYYQNTTQILLNSFESSSVASTETFSHMVQEQSANGIHYDAVKSGHVMEISGSESESITGNVIVASMSSRRRRRREAAALTANQDLYARIANSRSHQLLSDELKDAYPVNRTIVFHCNDPEVTICVRAVLTVYNYEPDKSLTVNMKYKVDLNEVNNLLIEPSEFFIVLIDVDLNKNNGQFDSNEIKIIQKIEYNIISKHQLYGVPIWVIILAVIGGLLALALITYGLYRYGFFKRSTKEQMDKLVNDTQGDGETANLNTEQNRE